MSHPHQCISEVNNIWRCLQEDVLSTLQSWQEDRSIAGNADVLFVAALIHASEGNYVEALKACHAGQSLEL